MVEGPPSTEASTSKENLKHLPLQETGAQQPTQNVQQHAVYQGHVPSQGTIASQTVHTSQLNQTPGIPAGPHSWLTQTGHTEAPQYTYHHYKPDSWSNCYPTGAYPSPGSYQQQAPHVSLTSTTSPLPSVPAYLSQEAQQHLEPPLKQQSPPSPFRKRWDAVMRSFMQDLGLTQTLRGFEADMLMISPDWERNQVPLALTGLVKDLMLAASDAHGGLTDAELLEEPSDQRKLDYVHFVPGIEPRTPAAITKSISRLLAQSRARNDASNRQEFLLSLAEKRRKLEESGTFEATSEVQVPSCARTDAKTQNRDIQMKYDIAKNEDGPIRKTVKARENTTHASSQQRGDTEARMIDADEITAERYPALHERLQNIETHIAIRYVPSPPRSLLNRLKFLEDHLVQLEREYPPWAALHFNQPNRGWPPPPRPTPLIIPSHLTSSAPSESDRKSLLYNAPLPTNLHHGNTSQNSPQSESTESGSSTPKQKAKQPGRSTKSSLHRAVMERLEIQKAMNDLAGVSDGSNSAGLFTGRCD